MTSFSRSLPFYPPTIGNRPDPIIGAIILKDFLILQSLLNNASLEKINYRGYDIIHGFSALHIASWVGWIDGVKFLLQKGAPIESCDFNFKTSIDYAADIVPSKVTHLEKTEQ